MSALALGALAIVVVTSVLCALTGVLLVAKRESLVTEALSHAIVPGVVIAFLITPDFSSPLLILGAGATGVLMILLVQLIERTKLVSGDAPLGIVFPALFSIGVLLVSQHLGDQHFHADCIVDGNIQTAAAQRWRIGAENVSIGPKVLYATLAVLVLLVGFVITFFKELKIMVFDPDLASHLGFRPRALHLAWLVLVSLTIVVAFQVAGPVLTVALMIAPPAAAYLLTDRLDRMFLLSALVALAAAVPGFFLSWNVGLPAGGPISSLVGALFLVTLLLAPKHGILARHRQRAVQREALHEQLLVLQLAGGDALSLSALRASYPAPEHFDGALRRAERSGNVVREGDDLRATSTGIAGLPSWSLR